MLQFDGFIGLLDSRSFGTIWYWLVFAWFWWRTGLHVIGVPFDVVAKAHRAFTTKSEDRQEILILLDWLSLTVSRWQIGSGLGAIFLGICCFVLTSLGFLGFLYDLEMAQALILLLLPLAVVLWLRLRLARKLLWLIQDAQSAARPAIDVGGEAARKMVWHRRIVSLIAIIAAMLAGAWGMLWVLMHPNGM